MSKLMTGAAALAGVLAIGTAINETQKLDRAMAELSAATEAHDFQARRLQALQRQLTQLEREHTGRLSQTAPPKVAPTAKRPSADPTLMDSLAAQGRATIERGRELLVAHPELRADLMAYQQLVFAEDYGPLYRSLSFTAEQIALFEEALRQSSSFSFSIGDNTIGFSFASDQRDKRELEKQLRLSLGEEKYAQYQDYLRGASVRRDTARLASALYHTDSPLTGAQAARVTQILVDNRVGKEAGGTGISGSVNWEQVMLQAQSVLAPRQLQALQGQRVMAQYTEALIKARYTPPRPSQPSPSPAN